MAIFKTSEKTRKLANIEKVDWCDITENIKSMKNLFAKNVFEELKKLAPSAFKRCPLIGRYEFVNYAVEKALVNMLPIGAYSIKITGYSKKAILSYYNITILSNINLS